MQCDIWLCSVFLDLLGECTMAQTDHFPDHIDEDIAGMYVHRLERRTAMAIPGYTCL